MFVKPYSTDAGPQMHLIEFSLPLDRANAPQAAACFAKRELRRPARRFSQPLPNKQGHGG